VAARGARAAIDICTAANGGGAIRNWLNSTDPVPKVDRNVELFVAAEWKKTDGTSLLTRGPSWQRITEGNDIVANAEP